MIPGRQILRMFVACAGVPASSQALERRSRPQVFEPWWRAPRPRTGASDGHELRGARRVPHHASARHRREDFREGRRPLAHFIGFDLKARTAVVALSNAGTRAGGDNIVRHLLDRQIPLLRSDSAITCTEGPCRRSPWTPQSSMAASAATNSLPRRSSPSAGKKADSSRSSPGSQSSRSSGVAARVLLQGRGCAADVRGRSGRAGDCRRAAWRSQTFAARGWFLEQPPRCRHRSRRAPRQMSSPDSWVRTTILFAFIDTFRNTARWPDLTQRTLPVKSVQNHHRYRDRRLRARSLQFVPFPTTG